MFGNIAVTAHLLARDGKLLRKFEFPLHETKKGSAEQQPPKEVAEEAPESDLYAELMALAKTTPSANEPLELPPMSLAHSYLTPAESRRKLLPVFAEDTLFLLRKKISLATGIPIYRLHIAHAEHSPARNADTPIDMFYNILLNGVTQLEFDTRELFSSVDLHSHSGGEVGGRQPPQDMLYGCPIDFALTRAGGMVRVETTETFTMVSSLAPLRGDLNPFWCVDLHSFLEPAAELISGAPEANLRLLYNGFVLKFWPMITWDVFLMILRGHESQLREAHPPLVVDVDELTEHTKQVAELNRAGSTKRASRINESLRMAITFAEVTSIAAQVKIDVVRLFNTIVTSNLVPMVVLLPTPKQQMIRKIFPAARAFDNVRRVKTPAEFKKGIVIALHVDLTDFLGVMGGEHLAFVNIQANGALSVITKWREDYNVTFEKHFAILAHFINPFIEMLNTRSSQYMNGRFALFDAIKTNFRLLNVSLYWPRILTPATFKELRTHLKDYVGHGVFEPNRATNLQTEVLCYDFNAAGTSLPPFFIDYRVPYESFNYYSWMWNLNVARLWLLTYHGFQVRIVHRSTDVRIEVSNINQTGLEIFRHYTSGILAGAGSESEEVTVVNFSKRINKLNHTDPVLFKFNREQPNGKRLIYSVMCQGPKQPIPYSPEEVEALPASTQKKLTRYWNFTHNRPAYYLCPNPLYPHLAFQTGVHNDGYCIPCCQKLSQESQPFYRACLEHDPKKAVIERESKTNRHVLHFSRYQLDLGRVGACPMLDRILEVGMPPTLLPKRRDDPVGYLIGVPQHDRFRGPSGMLYSVALICGTEPKDFVKRVIRSQRNVELIVDLFEIYVRGNTNHINTRTPEELQTLWIESAWHIYNINIVVIDPFRNIVRTQAGYHKHNGLVVEKPGTIFEPYVSFDINTLATSGNETPSWRILSRRHYDFTWLKSLLTIPVVNNRINYVRVAEAVKARLAKIVIGDRLFGHIYSLGRGKEIYLSSDFVKDDGHEGIAAASAPLGNDDTTHALPIIDHIPFERLPFSAFMTFANDAFITITKVIMAMGPNGPRARIGLDAMQRLYFFDASREEVLAAGLAIGDDWHYDANEIFAAIHRGHGPLSTPGQAPSDTTSDALQQQIREDREFAADLSEAARHELENQLLYRHFVYVFILVLNKFRNRELRGRILDEIKGAKNFSRLSGAGGTGGASGTGGGLSRNDATTLHLMVTRYYRKTIAAKNWDAMRAILQAQKFDFDDEFLAQLKKLPAPELLTRVREMMASYIGGQASNVPESGDKKTTAPTTLFFDLAHYAAAPLVVPEEAAPTLFNLLVRDIQNPLMTHYFTTEAFEQLFEGLHSSADLTKFVVRPGEKIEFVGYALDSDETDVEERAENA